MKLDSKYFDRIRVKPEQDRLKEQAKPGCDWQGCDAEGGHRAPMGRGRDGQFFSFCLEHVREYNKSYNYFAGMSDDDVAAYQKAAVTGHRPTWSLGENSAKPGAAKPRATGESKARSGAGFSFSDPFAFFGEGTESETRRRPVRNLERKSLDVLDLDETATAEEIKSRFKQLAKRHHPDTNGGGKAAEEKLKEVIQAYNYLKSAGFC